MLKMDLILRRHPLVQVPYSQSVALCRLSLVDMVVPIDSQKPLRKTRTSHSKREISRRRFMVYRSASISEWESETHRFSFDQGGRDTENGDEKYANGVVIILV